MGICTPLTVPQHHIPSSQSVPFLICGPALTVILCFHLDITRNTHTYIQPHRHLTAPTMGARAHSALRQSWNSFGAAMVPCLMWSSPRWAQTAARLDEDRRVVGSHQQMPFEETAERIVNWMVDVLFPVLLEEVVEGVKSISQERIQHRTAGDIMDVLVPQIQGQSVSVPACSFVDVGTHKGFTSDDQGQATFESHSSVSRVHTGGTLAWIVAESDQSACESKPADNKADVTWTTPAEGFPSPSV